MIENTIEKKEWVNWLHCIVSAPSDLFDYFCKALSTAVGGHAASCS